MNNFLKGRLLFVRICLLLATIALIGIGVAVIYSVGHPIERSPSSHSEKLIVYYKKQLVFAAAGLVVFFLVNRINYRRLGEMSYWLFYGDSHPFREYLICSYLNKNNHYKYFLCKTPRFFILHYDLILYSHKRFIKRILQDFMESAAIYRTNHAIMNWCVETHFPRS